MSGSTKTGRTRVVIAGAGAAGFMGAVTCAEENRGSDVSLYEATAHPLAKVRISGGGRCNVTHACFDPHSLADHYPRGSKELIGPFNRFGPAETVAWFARRGVELKTEKDGRMFPVSDESATIVRCLMRAADEAGVRLVTGCGVRSVERIAGGSFSVGLSTGETVGADRVLVATGGTRGAGGLAIAEHLGHSVSPPIPSLFTFHVDDARLRGLEGVSAPMCAATVAAMRLCETGPVLVTHWGLSGPAILRLSAWGARPLCEAGYRFTLHLNWAEPRSPEEVRSALAEVRAAHPRRQASGSNQFGLPARLWERLVLASGIPAGEVWTAVSNERLNSLAAQCTASEFAVSGKSMNKEEFVTCGGVRLGEVDMTTMESRLCPGLHFAGEVLDIDGITGGFNFQSAWTTGWQAGRSMAEGL